ncbi:hypothetical protein Sme01_70420 [Sphaerisporangium melleum]|uniref:Uncharacterized protein n=1 Tax=Sphaerisporangium melleum TaxID=321316 RepID=A0A917RN18_9ACTN|nr:hypothetical protein GCM10007964_66880 [Sphaerisporangium melleum]GII74566.1 hypothetical protein Sme01_70420 [Sphaerisporangium melleum]
MVGEPHGSVDPALRVAKVSYRRRTVLFDGHHATTVGAGVGENDIGGAQRISAFPVSVSPFRRGSH